MVEHLAFKTGIVALASLAMSSSAAARTLDPATDFCTTVTMDPGLSRELGLVGDMSNNLSLWLIMPLRDALLSVDQVERSPERFHYEPWKVPACSTGGKAVKVHIRYSGRGESAPIEVRTEIRTPGRSVFTSLHVISVAEIASVRMRTLSINSTLAAVINNSMKSEAALAATWILKGKRNAL